MNMDTVKIIISNVISSIAAEALLENFMRMPQFLLSQLFLCQYKIQTFPKNFCINAGTNFTHLFRHFLLVLA